MCKPQCDALGLIEEARSAARQAERVMNLILVHGDEEEPRRVRRALLPFVGSIHKFLYGTLTEADAAEIQVAIKTIAADGRNTAALLANQTEIVEHELSSLNKRMLRLEAAADLLANKTVDNANRLDSLEAELSIKATLIQFKGDTEIITDAVLFAIKGLVHPRMMPPEIISRSAKTAEDAITFAKFPLAAANFSAIAIMKISRVSILFSKGYLIYHVAIPLIDMENFNLFKALPVPAIQGVLNISDVTAYIWPAHTYFAVSVTNRSYVPVPSEQVPKLRELMGTLIAVDPEPVREIRESAACEIKIAAGREIPDPGACDVRIGQLKETFWLRLNKPNTWIYSAKQPEDIFVQCARAEQIATQIFGTGILELREGCAAHTAGARLKASHTFTQQVNTTSFESLQFNVEKILESLNKSSHAVADLQEAIASEATRRAENAHGHGLESLKAGAGLREIASKAREIANRKATAFELQNLSTYAWIFGGTSWSLIGAIVVAGLVGWCILRYRAGKPMRDLAAQQRKMVQLEIVRECERSRSRREVAAAAD